MNTPQPLNEELSEIIQRSREMYAERVTGASDAPLWWNAVIITASSARQAERYEWEIQRRKELGKIPNDVEYMVIPDWRDERIGSGGATIQALGALMKRTLFRLRSEVSGIHLEGWWNNQRVLMVHSGGDSRRLPQYSLAGKLFTALPVKTPWGDVSTVFDELLLLSTAWAAKLGTGLLVASGDVLLTFDPNQLTWGRNGVSGVGILQPAEIGTQHGVYISDDDGRVYSFLQKASVKDITTAGGLHEGDLVAVDTGLLAFSPEAAAKLTTLSGVVEESNDRLRLTQSCLELEYKDTTPPVIDIYQQVTGILTGQLLPNADGDAVLRNIARVLHKVPFWCSIVRGSFTHVGTTTLFRKLMTEETDFTKQYAVQQRLGNVSQPGLRSAGVMIDSVLAAGGEIGVGAMAIECNLSWPVRIARGSVVHGLEGINHPIEIPEDTVVHQVPVNPPESKDSILIRVYGVNDDPKVPVSTWKATWFGRPILDELEDLGLNLKLVWPGLPPEEWTLWNAQLFPATTIEDAWSCARWMMHLGSSFSPDAWKASTRLSLATSAQWADSSKLVAANTRRLQRNWQSTAVDLATSGVDVRPLLAYSPGIASLAEVGMTLLQQANRVQSSSITTAASRTFLASQFLGQAGLGQQAEDAKNEAFRLVSASIQAPEGGRPLDGRTYLRTEVTVRAPARIDLGGGWSDTPPFCLDWGGTVLNIAIKLNGEYPISATVRRLDEPILRLASEDTKQSLILTNVDEILFSIAGDPFAVHKAALQMTDLFEGTESLAEILKRLGGGLEVITRVNLPLGSGLGTSSILGAALVKAIWEMFGLKESDQMLNERVLRLEQIMTTGGGWQDQAGGIFPGAKLVLSGPGRRQRLRVMPVPMTAERQRQLESRLILYFTGIRRIAKNLLQQVVGSYLARETPTIQVLHSIKTLAMEMAYALEHEEWDYLGQLLDRHWKLYQILDPNVTNAPLNGILTKVRPYISGAKLAGAGGGGFFMLLASSENSAAKLREVLREVSGNGVVYDWNIADEGMMVEGQPLVQ